MTEYRSTHGIQRAMTLVMPLADPSQAGIQALANTVFNRGDHLSGPLNAAGTIHFARFVIVGDNLVMASSYDGDFGDYIEMFVARIGSTFDLIMPFVVDPAPTPVHDHPDAFVEWVRARDRLSIAFYSSYPGFTVQQVIHALGVNTPMPEPPNGLLELVPAIPRDQLSDIQGLILRGFGQPVARHVVLEVVDASMARALLGTMATTAEPAATTAVPAGAAAGVDAVPRVTSAEPRTGDKPSSCCAIALTAAGLRALAVPEESVRSFPLPFLAGAPARAPQAGDTAGNAPVYWSPGFSEAQRIHVIVSLYASDATNLDAAFQALQAAAVGAFAVVTTIDAAVFDGDSHMVHFGYEDNISQPIVAGDPVLQPPDHQLPAAAGDFVLGYRRQFGIKLDEPQPMQLGRNGSFSVFRVMEQDVFGFEHFLETAGASSGLGKEKLAAKIVGRWRNGVPLELSPDTDSPVPPLPFDQINNFGYADDVEGLRCPIGSHIRRANPRDMPMKPAGDAQGRRIMRRAMPYGPRWNAGDPRDDKPRGLVGHFIGASLALQFETVNGEWINTGLTDPSITGTGDLLLGSDRTRACLVVESNDAAPVTVGAPVAPSFINTKASVYSFLPSLTALRWIAAL